jgi:hypothetical protein
MMCIRHTVSSSITIDFRFFSCFSFLSFFSFFSFGCFSAGVSGDTTSVLTIFSDGACFGGLGSGGSCAAGDIRAGVPRGVPLAPVG